MKEGAWTERKAGIVRTGGGYAEGVEERCGTVNAVCGARGVDER